MYWCVTVDYQQIANDNIANQIQGFTIDYGKFILIAIIEWGWVGYEEFSFITHSKYFPILKGVPHFALLFSAHQK